MSSAKRSKPHRRNHHRDDDDDEHPRRKHRPTAAEREHAEHVAKEAARRAAEKRRRDAERAAADREFKSINEPLVEAAIAQWRSHLSTPLSAEAPINPLDADAQVSSPFGLRTRDGVTELHIGTDLAPVDEGMKDVAAVAAVSGEVLFVGQWNVKSGNVVMIGGADGTIYTYSHLREGSTGALKAGDKVVQGQPIAMMGDTGEGTGPHLHFVIRKALSMEEMLADARVLAIKGGADVVADPELPAKLLKDSYPNKTLEQILEIKRLDFESYEPLDPKTLGRALHRGATISRGEPLAVPPKAPAQVTFPTPSSGVPSLPKGITGGESCDGPNLSCPTPSAISIGVRPRQ